MVKYFVNSSNDCLLINGGKINIKREKECYRRWLFN